MEGRVTAVLKVRLSSVDVAYNTIAVRLNGQQLPEVDSVDDIGYRIVDREGSGLTAPSGTTPWRASTCLCAA